MIGSGFIKIRDFTLVYGSYFLLSKIFDNFYITQSNIFFGIDPALLFVAGFCSTLLLLFDPGSYSIEKRFPYKKLAEEMHTRYHVDEVKFIRYLKISLNINSIIFEKNKLIYIFYFMFPVVFLLIYSVIFINSILDDVALLVILSLTIIMFLILLVAIYKKYRNKWLVFQDYVLYTAWYKLATNSNFVFEVSSENLRKSIELGDWAIAKDWCDKVQNEYQFEAKLKESRDKEYKEHINNLLNKFMKHCKYDGSRVNLDIGWCPIILDSIETFGLSKQLFSHFCSYSKYECLLGIYTEAKSIDKQKQRKLYYEKLTILGRQLKHIFDSIDIYPLPIQGGCDYCLIPTMNSTNVITDYKKKIEKFSLSEHFKSI